MNQNAFAQANPFPNRVESFYKAKCHVQVKIFWPKIVQVMRLSVHCVRLQVEASWMGGRITKGSLIFCGSLFSCLVFSMGHTDSLSSHHYTLELIFHCPVFRGEGGASRSAAGSCQYVHIIHIHIYIYIQFGMSNPMFRSNLSKSSV